MAITTEYEKLLIAENKRTKRRKYLRNVIVGMLASMVCAFSDGWMLMLAVGIAHAEWVPALPTIGYWWAVLIVYLLRGVFSKIAPARVTASDLHR